MESGTERLTGEEVGAVVRDGYWGLVFVGCGSLVCYGAGDGARVLWCTTILRYTVTDLHLMLLLKRLVHTRCDEITTKSLSQKLGRTLM